MIKGPLTNGHTATAAACLLSLLAFPTCLMCRTCGEHLYRPEDRVELEDSLILFQQQQQQQHHTSPSTLLLPNVFVTWTAYVRIFRTEFRRSPSLLRNQHALGAAASRVPYWCYCIECSGIAAGVCLHCPSIL